MNEQGPRRSGAPRPAWCRSRRAPRPPRPSGCSPCRARRGQPPVTRISRCPPLRTAIRTRCDERHAHVQNRRNVHGFCCTELLTLGGAESAGRVAAEAPTSLSVISLALAHAREPFLGVRADPASRSAPKADTAAPRIGQYGPVQANLTESRGADLRLLVGVAGFEPAASSSPTRGAAGRLTIIPASSGCWRSCWLAAVRARRCTFSDMHAGSPLRGTRSWA